MLAGAEGAAITETGETLTFTPDDTPAGAEEEAPEAEDKGEAA
jgi:hypothetical protein